MEKGRAETLGKVSISGSLKHKLTLLESSISRILEEIHFQKREVSQLNSEKDTLEKVLEQKAAEVKKSLEDEVNRTDSEMRTKFISAKGENNKLQGEITNLKQEKTTLQQHVLLLQRKLSELELVVGQQHN